MKTGFDGTFVISWSQVILGGEHYAPVSDMVAGTVWSWQGDAMRVDGPNGIMPLGIAQEMADIRKRAAHTARKLISSVQGNAGRLDMPDAEDVLSANCFRVTNGYDSWIVTLISNGVGRHPLCLFQDEMPPRGTDLWIVDHQIKTSLQMEAEQQPGGVVCFTPGTMIMTPEGAKDVASLQEGEFIQTADNGRAEVLWIGKRRISGARMKAIPSLTPIRLRAGALDKDVPDAGLLVSPDHRMILRGARAKALYNSDEVLVTASDLINDNTILREHNRREVTYIHVMLPKHEVVFANGVATESFHPQAAQIDDMDSLDRDRLFERLPTVLADPEAYGGFARRVLTSSEAAIMHFDGRHC